MIPEIIEYKLVNRDLKRVINRRIYRSMNVIDGSYEDKYQVISLKGDDAKEYINRVMLLLLKVFDELPLDIPAATILAKLYKNFSVFRQIKSNWSIDGWEGEKPTFNKLLSFDVDKNTGLITHGELQSFIDIIRTCKDYSKEEVNKYFREWVGNPSKLTISEYITLLKLSNREAMSQVDSQKLEDVPASELKIINPKKGMVRVCLYQYNSGNAMEFVEVDLDSAIVNEHSGFLGGVLDRKNLLFKEIAPIHRYRKESQLRFDKKFENLFKNIIINDADFIKRQIEELLYREYDYKDISKIIKSVKVISVALKTPYNQIDKDFLPEVNVDNKQEYGIFIRINNDEEDIARYIVA